MRRMQLLRVALVALLLGSAASARADDAEEARAQFEKGLGAFALGNYVEAADHYEKAFALKPDPALLYNAAQSHRLAGNKQRALLLYTNYLRLFGGRVKNKDEVNRHIADLKAAIAVEAKARNGEPTTVESTPRSGPQTAESAPEPARAPEPAAAPPPAAVDTAHAPAPAATAAPLTSPPPTRDERPVTRKPWFWAVVGVGALVVVGVGVGLGVGLSGGASNPTPSLGVATVR